MAGKRPSTPLTQSPDSRLPKKTQRLGDESGKEEEQDQGQEPPREYGKADGIGMGAAHAYEMSQDDPFPMPMQEEPRWTSDHGNFPPTMENEQVEGWTRLDWAEWRLDGVERRLQDVDGFLAHHHNQTTTAIDKVLDLEAQLPMVNAYVLEANHNVGACQAQLQGLATIIGEHGARMDAMDASFQEESLKPHDFVVDAREILGLVKGDVDANKEYFLAF